MLIIFLFFQIWFLITTTHSYPQNPFPFYIHWLCSCSCYWLRRLISLTNLLPADLKTTFHWCPVLKHQTTIKRSINSLPNIIIINNISKLFLSDPDPCHRFWLNSKMNVCAQIPIFDLFHLQPVILKNSYFFFISF